MSEDVIKVEVRYPVSYVQVCLDTMPQYSKEAILYCMDAAALEEDEIDPTTGEQYTQLVKIPSSVLENLQGTVKVDITPKGAFDRYARELSLENYLKQGFFNAQKVNELRYYAEALPDDSVAPKQELLDICDKINEEQEKIAAIDTQAQIMQR